jgi:hypothetical protein
MGDRANIIVKDGSKNPIFLYTHWAGSELPATLQEGLKRGRPRWDDDSYLTRILFCEMIQDDVLGETGYGISTSMPDNEHNYLIVDVPAQKVIVAKYDYRADRSKPLDSEHLAEYSFEDYCALNLEDGYPWEKGDDGEDDD